MIQLVHRQKNHMGQLFSALQGNARVIVVTEAIAAVPFQWVGTYLPLYMLALGVNKVQIGLLSSVLILTKLLSTLFGGAMADRFGRKRVLVVFDILCWGVPMFLYAIAQNGWYFLAGRLINGFVYIVLPSFECLFVEDVPVAQRASVFGALQLLTAVARLLAPVAGLLVATMGLVPAGRVIMAVTMVATVSNAVVRQFTMHETTMGQERMSAVAGKPALALVAEYAAAMRGAARNHRLRIFLAARSLSAFVATLWGTYAVIYLTDERGIALQESTVAVLPFVSAVATIAAILVAANRLRPERIYGSLILGQGLWLLCALFFVLSPAKTVVPALLWATLDALSVALTRPAEQSLWANTVRDRQRAQVFAGSSTLIALVSLPAGPIAGALYTRLPQAPFWLGMALQLVVLGLYLSLRGSGQAQDEGQAPTM